MHAHLMGAPGLEPAFEQRGDGLWSASEDREHLVVGHGFASTSGHGEDDRHLGAARLVAADRRVDRAVRTRRRAPHKGKIAALKRTLTAMIGELLGERAMGLIGLGNYQEAARVLVEAMHDAGTRHAADA